MTDGAYSVAVGWKRFVKGGRVFVQSRAVFRDFETERYRGRSVKFVWGMGQWRRVFARSLRPRTDAAAYRFGGWNVKGLRRYP